MIVSMMKNENQHPVLCRAGGGDEDECSQSLSRTKGLCNCDVAVWRRRTNTSNSFIPSKTVSEAEGGGQEVVVFYL